jgi:O-antigen ligase
MVVAAAASGPPGNLRQATNEAWLWIGGVAVFTAARRLMVDRSVRRGLLTLLLAISAAMAVHALHQHWISLPRLRAEYLADPDAMLRDAGIDAPKKSAARMVFANRLLDGGPSATFALANSLAAVLMVGVIVSLGELRRRGIASMRQSTGVVWAAIATVGGMALVATRSRSAIGACLLAIAWLWFFGNGFGDPLRRRVGTSRRLLAAIVLVVASAALLTLGIALLGDGEWIAQAPASLEFRLRYWKSTSAMVLDHPLFGAGPGGFQAMYLAYRLPVARETIADPHNFVFETLAAGGIPAAMLLVALVGLCVRFRGQGAGDDPVDDETAGPAAGSWLLGGGSIVLALIWLFGFVSNQMPDVSASLFAVPAGIAAGWFFRRTGRAERSTTVAILAAVLIHLTVAGGWTVPGVAVLIWTTAAMLTVPSFEPPSRAETDWRVHRRWAAAAFVAGALLLVALRFVSIVPVQNAQLSLLRAEDALRRGITPRVESESAAAVAADRWDHQPALWRSEWLKNRLIAGEASQQLRSQWRAAADTAAERAVGDPLVIRSLADQALHLYQRYGRPDELQLAARWLDIALKLNPTDESLAAQAALVAERLGRRERAERLAGRARELSELGNNVVRDLELVHVLAVRPVGMEASRGPVQVSAEEEFAWRFDVENEP